MASRTWPPFTTSGTLSCRSLGLKKPLQQFLRRQRPGRLHRQDQRMCFREQRILLEAPRSVSFKASSATTGDAVRIDTAGSTADGGGAAFAFLRSASAAFTMVSRSFDLVQVPAPAGHQQKTEQPGRPPNSRSAAPHAVWKRGGTWPDRSLSATGRRCHQFFVIGRQPGVLLFTREVLLHRLTSRLGNRRPQAAILDQA